MSTTLAVVESCWWWRAESLLLQIGTDLQIGFDRADQTQPKVRALAMTEEAPAPFCRIVGWFLDWVVQECARPTEVVCVEMLLLPAERSESRRGSVCAPDLVPLLRFLRRPSVSQVVFPDCEPFLQEGARHAQLIANRSGQQTGELLLFLGSQVLIPMKEQGALRPQVFMGTPNLIPVAPGGRWRINLRQKIGNAAQFGDRGSIGWR